MSNKQNSLDPSELKKQEHLKRRRLQSIRVFNEDEEECDAFQSYPSEESCEKIIDPKGLLSLLSVDQWDQQAKTNIKSVTKDDNLNTQFLNNLSDLQTIEKYINKQKELCIREISRSTEDFKSAKSEESLNSAEILELFNNNVTTHTFQNSLPTGSKVDKAIQTIPVRPSPRNSEIQLKLDYPSKTISVYLSPRNSESQLKLDYPSETRGKMINSTISRIPLEAKKGQFDLNGTKRENKLEERSPSLDNLKNSISLENLQSSEIFQSLLKESQINNSYHSLESKQSDSGSRGSNSLEYKSASSGSQASPSLGKKRVSSICQSSYNVDNELAGSESQGSYNVDNKLAGSESQGRESSENSQSISRLEIKHSYSSESLNISESLESLKRFEQVLNAQYCDPAKGCDEDEHLEKIRSWLNVFNVERLEHSFGANETIEQQEMKMQEIIKNLKHLNKLDDFSNAKAVKRLRNIATLLNIEDLDEYGLDEFLQQLENLQDLLNLQKLDKLRNLETSDISLVESEEDSDDTSIDIADVPSIHKIFENEGSDYSLGGGMNFMNDFIAQMVKVETDPDDFTSVYDDREGKIKPNVTLPTKQEGPMKMKGLNMLPYAPGPSKVSGKYTFDITGIMKEFLDNYVAANKALDEVVPEYTLPISTVKTKKQKTTIINDCEPEDKCCPSCDDLIELFVEEFFEKSDIDQIIESKNQTKTKYACCKCGKPQRPARPQCCDCGGEIKTEKL